MYNNVFCHISFLGTDVLRFALIGMTGTGKSATGNSIVGAARAVGDMLWKAWNRIKPFASKASSQSVTVEGKRQDVELFGRKIAIVDTPGFFDTKFSEEETTKEILRCTYRISPGPHALLLVVKTERQTPEIVAALEHMKRIFGPELVKYLIIIFTGLDNIERDDGSIDEYVANVKPEYKNLLKQAQNRYVAFNNTAHPASPENHGQVKKLIEMADQIASRNNGRCYSNALLEESYEMMKEARIAARIEGRFKVDNEKYEKMIERVERTERAAKQQQGELLLKYSRLQDQNIDPDIISL